MIIENNTWEHVDVEFLFSWPTLYLTSERSTTILFYKLTKNYVVDDFPEISDHFPKILEKLPG